MTKISPSMLSCDFSRMGEETVRVDKAGADWIHLDVMDGVLVPNITFGPAVISAIRGKTRLPFDAHVMMVRPDRYVDEFVKAGCDMVTVHVETGEYAVQAVDMLRDAGIKAGITLCPETNISAIDPFLGKVDLVLIMSVKPGFGGQSFMPMQLDRIRKVAEYREQSRPELEISVDGGINAETGRMCVEAGATALVAGSSLFRSKDMAADISAWKRFGPNAG